MDDLKLISNMGYAPNNAVMVVAGNVKADESSPWRTNTSERFRAATGRRRFAPRSRSNSANVV